jgi:hypothetical protein
VGQNDEHPAMTVYKFIRNSLVILAAYFWGRGWAEPCAFALIIWLATAHDPKE